MRLHWLTGLAVLVLLLGMGCTTFKRWAYEGWGRDGWQKPDEVVAALGLARGARVADLGAGGGYFTFRLADAVESDGKVYAVDVDPGMLEYLEGRVSELGAPNVEVVMAAYDDPKLPEAVDLIFSVNTYHHIEERSAYFERAARYLRPGGRIVIIEYRDHGWLSWIFPHHTDPEVIRNEMQAAGYRLEKDHTFLSRQSFLVFARDG